jgi:hypothetical protein
MHKLYFIRVSIEFIRVFTQKNNSATSKRKTPIEALSAKIF